MVEIKMKPVLTAFAAVSATLTILIAYYNFRIVEKFRQEEKTTATKLVLKDQIPDAFMVLSIGALFFSLGTFLGAGTLMIKMEVFSFFSEIGVLTMLVGLLTFMKRIFEAVTSETDEGILEEAEKEIEEIEEELR
ncbi:MAG: hypothetical protein ABEJ93_03525 [Candidatus Nanohalobium sp.]